jgi:c-di-GMP-binding flagellar brake protein YcgR
MDEIVLKNLNLFEQTQFIMKNELYDGKILKKYDECLAIKIYILQDNYVPFQVNDVANYILISENEALRCTSKVLGSTVDDNFNVVLLEKPKLVNKIERREHPRLKIVKDIEYCFLPNRADFKSIDEISYRYYSKLKKTFTIDLSSGGVSLITYESNSNADNALIKLHLDEDIDIDALCTIIRVEQNDNNYNYKTALKFKEIDQAKVKLINNFVNKNLKLKK